MSDPFRVEIRSGDYGLVMLGHLRVAVAIEKGIFKVSKKGPGEIRGLLITRGKLGY